MGGTVGFQSGSSVVARLQECPNWDAIHWKQDVAAFPMGTYTERQSRVQSWEHWLSMTFVLSNCLQLMKNLRCRMQWAKALTTCHFIAQMLPLNFIQIKYDSRRLRCRHKNEYVSHSVTFYSADTAPFSFRVMVFVSGPFLIHLCIGKTIRTVRQGGGWHERFLSHWFWGVGSTVMSDSVCVDSLFSGSFFN